MRKVDSSSITAADLAGAYGLWIYNGLDNCVTRELPDILEERHSEHSRNVYRFERALQAPALTMMRRGVKVDTVKRSKYLAEYAEKFDVLERHLNVMAEAVWRNGLNARSHEQLKSFFYGSMGFTPIVKSVKGEKKVSMDRETLEKLLDHFWAQPIAATVMAIRDLGGFIKVLNSGVDSDGRIRVSYNVAGTETGRWSSSKNVFGGGTNFQNITPSVRDMFVADPGYRMVYADLEQAESRVVAYESQDDAYIEACEHGDLHSIVAKMVFGIKDDQVHDSYYRHFSFRDISKRAGHATNYRGSPFTLAKTLRIPLKVITEFQQLYFGAFPGIPRWHKDTQIELQTTGRLVTALGRERQFFGRLFDDSTLREAIAFKPQSTVGDLLNIGLLGIYSNFEPRVQLLGQIHDAVLFQVPEDDFGLAQQAVDLLKVPILVKGRTMLIPVEAKVGYDWKNMAKIGSEKALAQTRPDLGTFLDAVL